MLKTKLPTKLMTSLMVSLLISLLLVTSVSAIIDDGISGCTDPIAENYNPDATIDNGSCIYGDADGDGILDNDDECINEAGPRENDGCPVNSDGDGLNDDQDSCPSIAGPISNNGCPIDLYSEFGGLCRIVDIDKVAKVGISFPIEASFVGYAQELRLYFETGIIKLPILPATVEKSNGIFTAMFSTADPLTGHALITPGEYIAWCFGANGTAGGDKTITVIGRNN